MKTCCLIAEKIQSFNAKIKACATANKFAYADYYSAMHDENHSLIQSYSIDGVHPSIQGYEVMEKIAKEVISKTIK